MFLAGASSSQYKLPFPGYFCIAWDHRPQEGLNNGLYLINIVTDWSTTEQI
jgi:hypothetical protein